MDPVTIVSLAGFLTKGAYQVSTFIASSANVDTTITELQAEVVGLGNVLKSIEQSLRGPAAARKGGGVVGEAELWTSLAFAIKDAERTIGALQGTVQGLLATKPTGFLKRLVKQAKLNFNADEISAIRARIHTHTSSLQAALQMATILITSDSSDQINEIGPKLDGIVQDLKQLISNQANTNDKLPLGFRNPDILTHTERLISSASTVIGQGSTIWGGSEMGLPHSSEAGGSLDKASKSHIEDWIPKLTIMEEEGSQTSESKALTAPSETVVGETGIEGEESEYSDSDGDDDHDFAQMCFEQAEEMFKKKEHSRAIESFHAGLNRATTLSLERQNRLHLGNIKRELALSLLHQGRLTEAEVHFQTLARGNPRDLKGAELAYHASSGLAQVFMCKRSYTDAELWCKNSRNGWRRALAKGAGNKRHPLYIDSLKLSAFLYELRGDSMQAMVYEMRAQKDEGLIDEKSRENLSKGFTLEQSLEIINNYHRVHPASEEQHDAPPTPEAAIQSHPSPANPFEEMETPPIEQEQGCIIESPKETPKLFPAVSVTDLGHSPLSDSSITARENSPLLKRSSVTSDSRTSSSSQVPFSNLHPVPRTESVFSDESYSIRSESTQADSRSFTQRLQDSRARSALREAARKGDVAAVERALAKGVPIESTNDKGETPLCLAVIGGHVSTISTLLSHNAQIEARTKKGSTPLLCARENVSTSRINVMRALLSAGANIDAKDENGDTALHHAVSRSRPDWVKFLLSFTPNLELQNNTGETPLLRAVDFSPLTYAEKIFETVQLLLEAGADTKAADDKGQTAVLVAIKAIALKTAFEERYWSVYVDLVDKLCKKGASATKSSVVLASLEATKQIKDKNLKAGVMKALSPYIPEASHLALPTGRSGTGLSGTGFKV